MKIKKINKVVCNPIIFIVLSFKKNSQFIFST